MAKVVIGVPYLRLYVCAGMPAGKNTAAEKGAFQGVVAMIASAAKASHFAGSIEPGNWFTRLIKHL